MGRLISYETFLLYKYREEVERKKRKEINEHLNRMKALLGHETDPIYEEDE